MTDTAKVGFDWFQPEQTARIRDQLNAAGDGAHMEVHPHEGGLKIRVVRAEFEDVAAFDDDGGTNHSVHCPPICP